MAYDEYLQDRINKILSKKGVSFEEKKMFGGLSFMINNKMAIGIVKNELMARVGPDYQEEALKRTGAKIMDFTGRPMKGYIFVEPNGFDDESDLEHWIDKSLTFNATLPAS